MTKLKLLIIAVLATFAFGASPAMAQVSGDDGASGPPIENNFVAPNEFGAGCSRERPRDCTPDQRDDYNEIVMLLCTIAGGTVGIVDGAGVSALLVASGVGAAAAPIAGPIHGLVVGGATATACYSRFKIPNI